MTRNLTSKTGTESSNSSSTGIPVVHASNIDIYVGVSVCLLGPGGAGYPTQGAGYPTQATAPMVPPAEPPPYSYGLCCTYLLLTN